jgi:hypothetical protein
LCYTLNNDIILSSWPKAVYGFSGIELVPLLAAPINVLVCKFGPALQSYAPSIYEYKS